MTQIIEPNENSDLDQASVRRWVSQAFTGILSGFELSDGAAGFQVTIQSGEVWINGVYVDDDETRLNLDLGLTAGVDKHYSVVATHTPAATFPPPSMTITAVTNGNSTVPTVPADSVKLADIFVPAAATGIGDCTIVNAPKLPDRGANDGDVIVERLVNSNMNLLFNGGAGFNYDAGTDTLSWNGDIELIAPTITNREAFASTPLAAARIIGPDSLTGVGDNAIVFAVLDRTVAGDPTPPISTTVDMHVLDLDNPDPAETPFFYSPLREQIVFLGATFGGVFRPRNGISTGLPAAVANNSYVLRNKSDGNHYWGPITSDMIQAILSITSLTPSPVNVELGDDVGSGAVEHDPLSFTAVYAEGPPTTTELTNDANANVDDPLAQDPGAGASFDYQGAVLKETAAGANRSVTFTLEADAGDTPATRNATVNWWRRAYVGGNATDPGTTNHNDAFLKALMDKAGAGSGGANFQGVAANTSQVFAGKAFRFQATLSNEYLFIAYDAANGDLTAIKDKDNSDQNVIGAFQKVDTGGQSGTIATENADAIGEDYIVYRSNNLLNGTVDYETE